MNKDKIYRITLVAVALIALVVGVWWLQGRQERGNQAERDQQRYNSLVRTNDTLASNRKYDQAAKELQDYLATKPPQKFERGARVLLATTYVNAQKYDEALTWYQKVEKQDGKDKADVAVGMAYTYDAKGDKENAIKYFQKAIALAEKSDDPMANADKKSYEYEIKRLRGEL